MDKWYVLKLTVALLCVILVWRTVVVWTVRKDLEFQIIKRNAPLFVWSKGVPYVRPPQHVNLAFRTII